MFFGVCKLFSVFLGGAPGVWGRADIPSPSGFCRRARSAPMKAEWELLQNVSPEGTPMCERNKNRRRYGQSAKLCQRAVSDADWHHHTLAKYKNATKTFHFQSETRTSSKCQSFRNRPPGQGAGRAAGGAGQAGQAGQGRGSAGAHVPQNEVPPGRAQTLTDRRWRKAPQIVSRS